MNKEAIGTGITVTEAQEDACRQLGVETHEAEIEVIQMPEKKKFGFFGGSLAKVRAYINISPAEIAATYLKSILDAMGLVDITMTINNVEGGSEINLEGEDVGFIIGRRGETLDALQYLSGLVANHVENSYYRITINTGNYREKREKTLEILGRKLAFKAIKTGRNNILEPMNPYERRIIHTAVQKINGAASWSEGESINRHVVIGLDPKAPKTAYQKDYNKGSYNRGPKRTFNNNGYNNGYKKPYTNNSHEEINTDKKPLIEENEKISLYGKIEKNNE